MEPPMLAMSTSWRFVPMQLLDFGSGDTRLVFALRLSLQGVLLFEHWFMLQEHQR